MCLQNRSWRLLRRGGDFHLSGPELAPNKGQPRPDKSIKKKPSVKLKILSLRKDDCIPFVFIRFYWLYFQYSQTLADSPQLIDYFSICSSSWKSSGTGINGSGKSFINVCSIFIFPSGYVDFLNMSSHFEEPDRSSPPTKYKKLSFRCAAMLFVLIRKGRINLSKHDKNGRPRGPTTNDSSTAP